MNSNPFELDFYHVNINSENRIKGKYGKQKKTMMLVVNGDGCPVSRKRLRGLRVTTIALLASWRVGVVSIETAASIDSFLCQYDQKAK